MAPGMKRGIVRGAATLVVISWVTPTGASTFRVPSEHLTINAALDASSAGDTVLVAPGTYTDFELRSLWTGGNWFTANAAAFMKGDVVLKSEAGPEMTTLDLQGQGLGITDVINVYRVEGDSVVVDGFTLTGVPDGNHGIWAYDAADLFVRNCRFIDMDAGGGAGGGAGIVGEETDLTVEDSTFENLRGGRGAAILSGFNSHLNVTRCEFLDCSNGAIYVTHSIWWRNVRIRDSHFEGNGSSGGSDGAIVALDTGSTWITDCTFVDNESAGVGGAVAIQGKDGYETHRVTGCVFWRNRAGSAGAVSWRASGGLLRRNTFVECSVTGIGSAVGLAQDENEHLEMEFNIFAYCSGATAVRLAVSSSVQPDARCNLFWGNVDGDYTFYQPAESDVFLDPLFCDLINGSSLEGDFTVADTSPCLPENGTGCPQIIGARGMACTDLATEPMSWGRIKGLYH